MITNRRPLTEEQIRRNMKKYMRSIGRDIKKHGRHIVGVFPTEEDDPLPISYTIGNQERGLPELLVIGTPRGTYLNELSDRMVKCGNPFNHGDIIKTGEKTRIKIINATHEAQENYTIQAGDYYETQDYQVQQIILSDEEGRLPGEVGCDPRFAQVPILTEKLH